MTVNLPSTSSLWTLASKPATETHARPATRVELGVTFQAATGGFVNGIRFYKGFYNIGEHVVDLWTSTGTLLASGVSVGESLSGWQTVTFSSPVHINPGTTYVASYHTDGYWSATTTISRRPTRTGSLAFCRAAASTPTPPIPALFPTNTPDGNTNYWVDVVFSAGSQPGADGKQRLRLLGREERNAWQSRSPRCWPTTRDPNGDPLTITAVGSATNGTVTLDTQTGNVLFTPNADYSGPATFSYTVSDGRGGTGSANVAVTVVPDPAGVTLFQNTEGPSGPAFNDGVPLELGMKFTASVGGTITGIRFYKPAGATGRTPARCGPRPGRCSQRSPSPTNPSAAGRPLPSPTRCRSRKERPTSLPITRPARMWRTRTISRPPTPGDR